MLRGARGGADADREHAARDPDHQRRGAARARGAIGRAAGRRGGPLAGRVLRAGRGRARCGCATRCGWCTCAASSCRRRCRPGVGAMAAIIGLSRRGRRPRVCSEAAGAEVVSPANLNGGGQIVIAGHKARGRARVRGRQGARREARDAAAGERAVPLRADAAGRRRLAAELARVDGRRPPACRSSRNVEADAEPGRGARAASCWRAGDRAGALGGVGAALAGLGVDTRRRARPGNVLAGLVQAHRAGARGARGGRSRQHRGVRAGRGDASQSTASVARQGGAGHRRLARHRPRDRASRSGALGAKVVVNYTAQRGGRERGGGRGRRGGRQPP